MDPVTTLLATRAVGFLAAMASSGVDAFGKSVGVATVDKVSEVLAGLRRRWAGDPEARTTLDQFQHRPEQHAQALTQLLAERMERDPNLAAEIKRQVNSIDPRLEIRVEGEEIKVVRGPKVGHIRKGTVISSIKVKKSDEVDAGTFGDIGDRT